MRNAHNMDDRDDFKMTTVETARLAELEKVIAENFQGFYAVGCALVEIKANRLYRMQHLTFEDYCRERFEIARRTAYQYIEAAGVMENVRNCAQFELLPMNEAQIRPLTRLKNKEEQIQAWEQAVKTAPQGESGPIITAQFVNQVVKSMLGKNVQERVNKIKKDIEPVVSKEFADALWAFIEVVRAEAARPLKAKTRKIMAESIRRVENLLAE